MRRGRVASCGLQISEVAAKTREGTRRVLS